MERSSEYIHKRHNVSVIMYHFVCPAKYRKVVFSEEVDNTIKFVCEEMEKRYALRFLEIGTDKDHVHFLVQATPTKSPTQLITAIKSITAREVFARHREVKKQLWGGQFWTDGYYVSTVGKNGNETVIANYVKEQGREHEYKKLSDKQLSWFED